VPFLCTYKHAAIAKGTCSISRTYTRNPKRDCAYEYVNKRPTTIKKWKAAMMLMRFSVVQLPCRKVNGARYIIRCQMLQHTDTFVEGWVAVYSDVGQGRQAGNKVVLDGGFKSGN